MSIFSNLAALSKAIKEGDFRQIDGIVDTVSKNIEKMKSEGGNTNDLQEILSLTIMMKQNLKEVNKNIDEPQIDSDLDGDDYVPLYNKRLLQGLTELSNPVKLAKLKHDIALETKYIALMNGKDIIEKTSETAKSITCNTVSQSNDQSSTPEGKYKYRRTDNYLNDDGLTKLMYYVQNDIQRQQNIHLVSLQLDILLKMVYVHQETELLDSMLEQQDALVRGLSDWSDYLDQQTNEYAEMYEKMDALISTQRRKSSFTVRDIQSLEKWTYGSHVVFWILVASCLLMVIVYNFTSIQKVAKSVDKNMNKLREST